MFDSYRDIFDFQGKRVVVTGGAGLLGREISKCFAAFNARVIVSDIDESEGVKFVEDIRANNGTAHFRYFDQSDVSTIPEAVAGIEGEYGPIDIWINSAYPRTADWGEKLEDILIESWRKNIDMHLNGYCISSNEIARLMASRRRGSIINIGSIQSIVAPEFSIYEGTDMTSSAAYTAIKGGILMYSKYLASYYGKNNIRVNVVCPGGISNNQSDVFVEKYNRKTLLGRMASAEEIAPAVLFLASDAASYITGSVLVVDGGLTTI